MASSKKKTGTTQPGGANSAQESSIVQSTGEAMLPPQVRFLGVLVPRASARVKAALVKVVKSKEMIMGVVVVADPSFGKKPLEAELTEAGYPGPFTYHSPSEFDANTKAAIARVLRDQRLDPDLDLEGALRSFGYNNTDASVSYGQRQR